MQSKFMLYILLINILFTQITTMREEQPESFRSNLVNAHFDKIEIGQPTSVPASAEVVVEQNFSRFFGFSLILATSYVQFGIALAEIGTTYLDELFYDYNVESLNISLFFALGLIHAMMPIGGIFGCFSCILLNRWASRKNTMLIACAIVIVSVVFMQINIFALLLVGRFLLGLGCGIYTVVTPQYIDELYPNRFKSLTGSVLNIGICLGSMYCYFYAIFLEDYQVLYRIVYIEPAFIAIFQAILIFSIVPDIPIKVKIMNNADINIRRASRKSFVLSIFLNISRQFMGATFILVMGGQLFHPYFPLLYQIILSSIKLVFSLISIYWLANRFGYRFLALTSAFSLSLCSFLSMTGCLIQDYDFLIASFCLYAVFQGLAYSPVSWSYPIRISTPFQNSIATAFTWLSILLITIIYMEIANSTVVDSYPIFLIFGLFSAISFAIILCFLPEIKDKSYQQIMESM